MDLVLDRFRWRDDLIAKPTSNVPKYIRKQGHALLLICFSLTFAAISPLNTVFSTTFASQTPHKCHYTRPSEKPKTCCVSNEKGSRTSKNTDCNWTSKRTLPQ